jgi:hypothetical protein
VTTKRHRVFHHRSLINPIRKERLGWLVGLAPTLAIRPEGDGTFGVYLPAHVSERDKELDHLSPFGVRLQTLPSLLKAAWYCRYVQTGIGKERW